MAFFVFVKVGGVRGKGRLSRYVEWFWTKKSFFCRSLFRYYIKQIGSLLPCVCSVIDHRRRQNAVRTSVTHSAIASCATFLFLPHFDVICDPWTDAPQHGNPSAEKITLLLEKVLKPNNFTFCDLNYIQIKFEGTAMSTTRVSLFSKRLYGLVRRPICIPGTLVWARIGLDTDYWRHIYDLERRYKPSWRIHWNHLNNAAPCINFTHEISKSQVYFLDTTITNNKNSDVETDVYQTPTDTHPYFHWTEVGV